MTDMTLMYLGPEGTFTHQAALTAAEQLRGEVDGFSLKAMSDIPSLMQAVAAGDGWGVIAWENNVEGYVVPNLDALIDAADLAGFAHVSVDVAFDAFVHGDADTDIDGADVFAHSHGLAQCKQFIAKHHLVANPTTSNAAACRDVQAGQVALGPSLCADLYQLTAVAQGVQDFDGAHTEFLVIAPRQTVQAMNARQREVSDAEFETIITFIPLVTGSGVLANLLDVIRDAGLNMTSFMSRPIKGRDGTYSFIATLDAAPWEAKFKSVIKEIVEHGDWVKTLAVYPRRERPNPPVDAWMLPQGGVHGDVTDDDATQRELLW